MPSDIRLLALDLDGTLLDNQKQIPARNIQALAAAREAGVEIVLVTGRRYLFALPIAGMLPFETVLIASNGAVVKSSSGTSYFRRLLPLATAARVLEMTRPWVDNTLLVYDAEDQREIVIQNLDKRTKEFMSWYERNRQYVTFAGLEDTLLARAPEDPLQIMWSGPVEMVRSVENVLHSAPVSHEYRLLKTEYEDRDLTILDAIHPHCSKGNALRAWTERLGLSREQVMAIGDNFNDREMLEFAGVAVVMGNAVEALKCYGWKETGHCDHAGVADAVEKWILA